MCAVRTIAPFAARELLEEFRAFDLVGEVFPVQLEVRGLGDRPREVQQRAKGAEDDS